MAEENKKYSVRPEAGNTEAVFVGSVSDIFHEEQFEVARALHKNEGEFNKAILKEKSTDGKPELSTSQKKMQSAINEAFGDKDISIDALNKLKGNIDKLSPRDPRVLEMFNEAHKESSKKFNNDGIKPFVPATKGGPRAAKTAEARTEVESTAPSPIIAVEDKQQNKSLTSRELIHAGMRGAEKNLGKAALGAAVGFAMGGPVGAVAGAALMFAIGGVSHVKSDEKKKAHAINNGQEFKQEKSSIVGMVEKVPEGFRSLSNSVTNAAGNIAMGAAIAALIVTVAVVAGPALVGMAGAALASAGGAAGIATAAGAAGTAAVGTAGSVASGAMAVGSSMAAWGAAHSAAIVGGAGAVAITGLAIKAHKSAPGEPITARPVSAGRTAGTPAPAR